MAIRSTNLDILVIKEATPMYMNLDNYLIFREIYVKHAISKWFYIVLLEYGSREAVELTSIYS
jgi:hypothetical protein